MKTGLKEIIGDAIWENPDFAQLKERLPDGYFFI